jgi:hypothetical protein
VPIVARSAKVGCFKRLRELRVASQPRSYAGFSALLAPPPLPVSRVSRKLFRAIGLAAVVSGFLTAEALAKAVSRTVFASVVSGFLTAVASAKAVSRTVI